MYSRNERTIGGSRPSTDAPGMLRMLAPGSSGGNKSKTQGPLLRVLVC